MKRREFLGHCYCDTRFKHIEDVISNGTLDQVLAIQSINEELKGNHRYQQVINLLKERLNGL
jgi:hypothetical protein